MTIAEYNSIYSHAPFIESENQPGSLNTYNYTNVSISENNNEINSCLRTISFNVVFADGSPTYYGAIYNYIPIDASGFADGWLSFSLPNGAFMKLKN